MQAINLLPDIKVRKKKIERAEKVTLVVLIAVGAFFVLASVAVIGLTLAEQGQKQVQQKRYDADRAAEDNLDKYGVTVTNLVTGEKSKVNIRDAGPTLQDELRIADTLVNGRLMWLGFLRTVQAAVPSGVTLSTASSDHNTVTVAGNARDFVALAKFTTGLEQTKGDVIDIAVAAGLITKDAAGNLVFNSPTAGAVNLGPPDAADAYLIRNPQITAEINTAYTAKLPSAGPVFSAVKLTGVTQQGGQVSFSITFNVSGVFFEKS